MFETLVIVFMAAAAPALPAAATPVPPPAEAKLFCRREPVTGSLVSTKKRCMTKLDWARTGDTSRQFARDMVDGNRGVPAGN